MRDIRFRAWFNNSAMIDWSDIRENWGFTTALDSTDFILMQYTGLKDKNGKEIYEKDICNIKDARTNPCTIEFSKGSFWWSDVNGGEFPYEYCQIDTLCSEGIEVIGNIYEHGHLLDA